jgi:hypothetical protein
MGPSRSNISVTPLRLLPLVDVSKVYPLAVWLLWRRIAIGLKLSLDLRHPR